MREGEGMGDGDESLAQELHEEDLGAEDEVRGKRKGLGR
jgi:hypothetical protein